MSIIALREGIWTQREREKNQGYEYREERSLRHRQKMDICKQRQASKETKSADTLVLDF